MPDVAVDVLARLRERKPRIHCLTNAVAQAFTANVLLAVGAVPSMTVAADEIAEFVGARRCFADQSRYPRPRAARCCTGVAVATATDERRPWVLDPVFVERSQPRRAFAKALAGQKPWAMRLNGAEFAALADAPASDDALRRYAIDRLCVVALTGAKDAITDGVRLAKIANGDPLMGQVTAMGCAGAALIAAALAVEADAWLAASAALLAFAVAGECAAAREHAAPEALRLRLSMCFTGLTAKPCALAPKSSNERGSAALRIG